MFQCYIPPLYVVHSKGGLNFEEAQGFVADINAGGIRMDHLQADVFALDLSLAGHLLPIALRWAADCFLGFLVFSCCLCFMLTAPR
jgi:hypothetical protein